MHLNIQTPHIMSSTVAFKANISVNNKTLYGPHLFVKSSENTLKQLQQEMQTVKQSERKSQPHLKTELGLPDDFKTNMCKIYPQYFKVVDSPRGLALELTSQDLALAVSTAELAKEKAREREIAEKFFIIEMPLNFKRVTLPKGLNLMNKYRLRLQAFKEVPFISLYLNSKDLNLSSMEAEKHACAMVYEILILTIEKRTLVDSITHFTGL